MTRRKRSRKSGPLASSAKDTRWVREERQSANQKKERSKGGKAGSRQQVAKPSRSAQAQPTTSQDPRAGSKKPLKLIQPGQSQPVEKEKAKPKPLFTTPLPEDLAGIQSQLLALEEDEKFMQQLEVVDQGGILPPAVQDSFEQKLQRYEQLLEKAETLDEADDPLAALMQGGADFKDDWS